MRGGICHEVEYGGGILQMEYVKQYIGMQKQIISIWRIKLETLNCHTSYI